MKLTEPSSYYLAPDSTSRIAKWANHTLLIGFVLFAASAPHSIAAAQISLVLCALAWTVRDISTKKFHFARTSLDWPIAGFAILTIVSALLSTERDISLPKLRALLLFLIIYLCATNLRPAGVRLLIGLMLISALTGVGFSLLEKIIGRGMVITTIHADSPLAQSNIQSGDVIWMIARRRVRSIDAANQIIQHSKTGESIEIEALHDGDPLPVEITVTDGLKTKANPLGIDVNGSSRRFRVSGFTRHFITYADQMQLFALLCFGALLAFLHQASGFSLNRKVIVSFSLVALFALALLLTASRAAIVSLLLSLFLVSALSAGKRIAIITLIAAVLIGGAGIYVLTSTRTANAISFNDDSALRRISYMRAGLKVIPEHPLFGVGMDSLKRHWKEWGFPGEYITHTHSTPIQIAMERGIPALLCYAWLMIAMCLLAWRGYREKKEFDWLMLGTFAALIGFSAGSFVNYNFGDSEILMLLFFLVGSVIAASRNRLGH